MTQPTVDGRDAPYAAGDGPGDGGWGQLDGVEREQRLGWSSADLRSREATGWTDLNPDEHVNKAYVVDLDDGSRGVYKPTEGETSVREAIPEGGKAAREHAAWRVDQDLGIGLTPVTTGWDGHEGPGSLQRWYENSTPGLEASEYTGSERERMAVFDYVTANTDRHLGNYRTGPDGELVAIDHGDTFPDSDRDAIRSDFVAEHLGRPLSPDLVDRVRSVDSDHVADRLRGTGLDEPSVQGALSRLAEVQDRGRITGEAWSGEICDSGWNVWRYRQ